MLRIAIILIAVILFFICTLPVLFVFKLLYPKYPEKIDHASLAIVKWAFRTVLRLSGTQLTVIGEENVPTDQPVLYVGNHTSFFDIIITYARMPGLTGHPVGITDDVVCLWRKDNENPLLPELAAFLQEYYRKHR